MTGNLYDGSAILRLEAALRSYRHLIMTNQANDLQLVQQDFTPVSLAHLEPRYKTLTL